MRLLLAPEHRRLLAAGLLLRLALMPLTMHSDVLDEYWRAHFVSHHAVLNLPGYFFTHYGFSSAPVLPMDLAHGLYLFVARPVLPDIHRLFTDGPEAMVVLTDLEHHRLAIHHFLSAGAAARWALVVFKLPYLLLDYAALALLLPVVAERHRRRLVAFWMLNFVSLFTLYMWGRYEIVTSLFCVAGLAALQARRPDRAALALGLATVTKYYPVLLLPGWAAAAAPSAGRRVRFAVLAALPPAALGAAALALSPPGAGTRLASAAYQLENVVRIGFDVGDAYWKEAFPLYPFVTAWTLLALFHLSRPPRRGPHAAASASIAVLMLFYALSAFSPQYLFWCVPFVALAVAASPATGRSFALLVAFFVLAILEFGSDLGNLFAPLFPALVDHPLQPRYAPGLGGIYVLALGVVRSVFAGLCGWLAWQARDLDASANPVDTGSRLGIIGRSSQSV